MEGEYRNKDDILEEKIFRILNEAHSQVSNESNFGYLGEIYYGKTQKGKDGTTFKFILDYKRFKGHSISLEVKYKTNRINCTMSPDGFFKAVFYVDESVNTSQVKQFLIGYLKICTSGERKENFFFDNVTDYIKRKTHFKIRLQKVTDELDIGGVDFFITDSQKSIFIPVNIKSKNSQIERHEKKYPNISAIAISERRGNVEDYTKLITMACQDIYDCVKGDNGPLFFKYENKCRPRIK